MGIRFLCPNGHRLNVKSFLAGKRAICPDCGARVLVPNPEPIADPRQVGVEASAIAAQPPAVGEFSVGDTATPSVVLTMAPTEVMLPEAISPTAPTAEDSLSPIPESVIAATSPTPAVVDPEDPATVAHHQLRRERRRRKQVAFSIALLVLVVVLAVILVLVLSRDANPPPAEVEQPTKVSGAFDPAEWVS
jgi:hypothetical protein